MVIWSDVSIVIVIAKDNFLDFFCPQIVRVPKNCETNKGVELQVVSTYSLYMLIV